MRIVNFIREASFNDAQSARLIRLGELIDVPSGEQTEEQTIAFLADADYALISPATVPKITPRMFSESDNLKGIIVNTTNLGWVDMTAAKASGVNVFNIPGYSTEAVAEFTIGLIFAAARNISRADREVKEKLVRSFEGFDGIELQSRTLGLIGFGDIGRRVAELAAGIGMEILVWNRTEKRLGGVTFVSKEELLVKSDIVSLHLALTPDTVRILSRKDMALMRLGAILVNTAREELIDQSALLEMLKAKRLRRYAFELNEEEWTDIRREIVALPNVIATPHIGWLTPEAKARMMEEVVRRCEELASGSST